MRQAQGSSNFIDPKEAWDDHMNVVLKLEVEVENPGGYHDEKTIQMSIHVASN
jgi:hypothetical protein